MGTGRLNNSNTSPDGSIGFGMLIATGYGYLPANFSFLALTVSEI